MKTKIKPWIKYAEDVINGNIVAGLHIQQSCKQYLSYINSDKYELRNEVVERAINFIKLFKHYKGKHSGKPFELQPWQMWVVSAIVGVYHKGTNIRKHSSVYLEISRKNGKTALCAALALYFLIADGMDGAEVGCLANSREQAKICYEFCEVFSKQLDPQQKNLKTYRDRIKFNVNNSKLLVCSSADDKLDGGNYTAAIIDEFHASKSNKLRDVIKSSMVRENSVLITITSAGFDVTGPCYKLRQTCIEILNNLKEDDSIFSAIYSIDEGDLWTDKNCWVKSTPNINITVNEDYIQKQVQSAINNPAEEVGVRTKTLNEWLQTSEVWIPDLALMKCFGEVDLSKFNECETYIGIDLAATSDCTAVSYLVIDEDGKKHYKTDYYLPSSALVESPNREQYKYWLQTKQLKVTEGNVTDYSVIINDIMANYNKLTIRGIFYDSWNSTQAIIQMTELGLPCQPYSQSIGHFNRPVKEMERNIREGNIVIDKNDITLWMFRNVQLKVDYNGNAKPNKGLGKDKKIDGVISMCEALGGYLETPHYSGEIFTL